MYVAFAMDLDWFIGQIKTVDAEEQCANIISMKLQISQDQEPSKKQGNRKSRVKKTTAAKKKNLFYVWPEIPINITVPFPNILNNINNDLMSSNIL